jgi:hypothetical protein
MDIGLLRTINRNHMDIDKDQSKLTAEQSMGHIDSSRDLKRRYEDDESELKEVWIVERMSDTTPKPKVVL